eukprot:g7304.t1
MFKAPPMLQVIILARALIMSARFVEYLSFDLAPCYLMANQSKVKIWGPIDTTCTTWEFETHKNVAITEIKTKERTETVTVQSGKE